MIEDIEFKAESLGKRSDDDKWEHYLWRVTLTYQGRSFSTDYRMGVGLVDKRPAGHMSPQGAARRAAELGGEYDRRRGEIVIPCSPTLLDVLGSLRSDCQLGDQLFEDFCDDLGYDTDSRKAEQTWRACQTMHYELRNLFGSKYTEFIDTDWEEITDGVAK